MRGGGVPSPATPPDRSDEIRREIASGSARRLRQSQSRKGEAMKVLLEYNPRETVLLASSVQDAIEAITRHYGVRFVTIHLLKNAGRGIDNPFVRTTYPADWVRHYLLNNLAVVDPVLKTSLRSDEPFDWSTLRLSAAEQELLLLARTFGLGDQGYSIPFTDGQGRKSIFSLNSAFARSDWLDFIHDHMETLRGIGRDLHLKAQAEASLGSATSSAPQLSPREHQCLIWTAEGKTYAEIALILELSEHTIRSYLKSARLKLDSVSMAQAVARAGTFGLI